MAVTILACCTFVDMARTTDARERAVQTAAQLFRRQGYNATGLTQILEESGAPKGSFYFHFPEGKTQLAVEAVRASSAEVESLMRHLADKHAGDPVAFVRAVARALGTWLERSGYAEGCPVATVALEMAPVSPVLREVCASSYAAWRAIVEDVLRGAGHPRARASRLATLVLSAVEGALVLGRAERSRTPLDHVAAELAPLLTPRGPAAR